MEVFSPGTSLKTVVKGFPADLPVSDLPIIRASQPKLWAKILLACEFEQTMLLNHLWADLWQPDKTTTAAMNVIVKRGWFLKFLDPKDRDTRELWHMLHSCVDMGVTLAHLGHVPINQD